ncbi:MAG: hypothetical protein J7647_30115 [Cyanobacteria bacterium SBLK]|nr:hypothetical protein [Cyanobacteria bacterium SBLK]
MKKISKFNVGTLNLTSLHYAAIATSNRGAIAFLLFVCQEERVKIGKRRKREANP